MEKERGRAPLEGTGGSLLSAVAPPLIVAAAVFAASLFGIYTRPAGFLATIWPANAILLGMLLRWPRAAGPLGWAMAFASYMAADLLTGASLVRALLLSSANMAGVGAAYFVYMALPADARRLRQPDSMLHLLVAVAAAGAAAGTVGMVANVVLFGGGPLRGWAFWLATEVVNYVVLLPVILALPAPLATERVRLPSLAGLRPLDVAPAAALLVSCVVAALVGGPGVLAFPVPALLWCGLAYPVFPTAVLTLGFGFWGLVAASTGVLTGRDIDMDEAVLVSLRTGVALIALAPIMLSSVMASRNDLMSRLRQMATQDQLTSTVNRATFLDRGQALLAGSPHSAAALMIDMDHFKAVNDQFGHSAGDEVLTAFAERVRNCLRGYDLFGRLGGEEFAVLLPRCKEADALSIAERIRQAVADAPIALADGRTVSATISVGLAHTGERSALLPRLLADADRALYAAKAGGRNRVELVSCS